MIILLLVVALILKSPSEVPTLTGYGTSLLKTDTAKFAFRLIIKYDKSQIARKWPKYRCHSQKRHLIFDKARQICSLREEKCSKSAQMITLPLVTDALILGLVWAALGLVFQLLISWLTVIIWSLDKISFVNKVCPFAMG